MRAIGEKELIIMKKELDIDMPIGELKEVADFLPPPSQLILPEDTVKVTLSLTKTSIEFFKRQAKRHNTKYQKMIRSLVDYYSRNR